MDVLIKKLKHNSRTVVLTGAGISKESGIPTFREAQTGLWERYDPAELASPQAFLANPKLVWEWYEWRRGLIAQAQPNAAHTALVELENRLGHFTLITQNVDGFHHLAGSRNILELHGNIQVNYCSSDRNHDVSQPDQSSIPPKCPLCGEYLRPGVVWFGENLPHEALDHAWQAAQQAYIFLSVGTSSLVQPAASLPLLAKRAGAYLVEINPSETPLSGQADLVLRQSASEALPEILRRLK